METCKHGHPWAIYRHKPANSPVYCKECKRLSLNRRSKKTQTFEYCNINNPKVLYKENPELGLGTVLAVRKVNKVCEYLVRWDEPELSPNDPVEDWFFEGQLITV